MSEVSEGELELGRVGKHRQDGGRGDGGGKGREGKGRDSREVAVEAFLVYCTVGRQIRSDRIRFTAGCE